MQQFSSTDLEAVGRRFSELTFPLSAAWSEFLGSEATLQVAEVVAGPSPTLDTLDPSTSTSLLDLVAGEGTFTAIGTFGLDLDAIALVIPTELGLCTVDRLLGGNGRPAGDREYSTIDVDLLKTVVEPTFATIGTLRPAGQGQLPVGRLIDPEETDLNERLSGGVVVVISVALGDQLLPLHVVLGPSATRELAGVRTAASHTTPLSKSDSERHMQAALQHVSVEVVVAFDPIVVPSHQLLSLDVGDVIALKTAPNSPLPLFVHDRKLASVLPARAGTHVACQVVSTFPSADETSATSASTSPAFGGSL